MFTLDNKRQSFKYLILSHTDIKFYICVDRKFKKGCYFEKNKKAEE